MIIDTNKSYRRNIPYLHIYALYLEDDKWYVGLTHNVEKRVEEHKSGSGARWTKIHKPIKLVYDWTTAVVSKRKGEDLETKKTIELMKQYGRENVRGGAFVSVNQEEIDSLLGEALCHEIDKASANCGEGEFDYLIKRDKSSKNRHKMKRESLTNYITHKNTTHYELDKKRRFIRIFFSSIPSKSLRKELISQGWDYYEPARYWSKYYDELSLEYAREICGKSSDIDEDDEELLRQEVESIFGDNENSEDDLNKASYILNDDKHRVEIYFNGVPDEDIINKVKADGWQYYWKGFYWHKKFSYKSEQFANAICNEYNSRKMTFIEKFDLPFN